ASVSGTSTNNSISYTPNLDYYGTDSFIVQIDDGNGGTNLITVNATINSINDIPTTTGNSITTDEDAAISDTLIAADIDANPLTYSIITNGAKGTATITNTSAFTYTPTVNANGADSFTFKVNDGLVDSNASAISVTINSINDAPTFTESAPHAITLNEDNSATAAISTSAYSFDLNATDIDVDTITWSIQTPATQGTASVSGTSTNNSISYTPNLDYYGTDSFIVQIDDGNGGTNLITVNATINPINDTPTVTTINDIDVTYGAATQNINLDDYFADVDNLNTELTYTLVNNTDDAIVEPSITSNTLNVLLKNAGNSNITIKGADPDGLEVQTSFNVSIGKASTSIETIKVFPTPSAIDQEVTFSFTVTAVSGSGITGDVTISDGTNTCVKTLQTNHSGESICRIIFTEQGDYSFSANYAGDDNYNPSSTKEITSHKTDNALIIYTTRPRDEYEISENGVGDIYYVELSTYPVYPVELHITPDQQLSINEASAGQTVTITLTDTEKVEIAILPVDDDVLEGIHDGLVTHVSASADVNYDAKTTEIGFPIIDNEAGIVINKTDGLTQLLEGEQTDSYSIRLSTEPIEQVKINIITDSTQVSAYPSSLTFSRSNWNEPQNIRLSAVDDQEIEGEHSLIVTHELVTEDTLYSAENITFTIDEQTGDGLNVNIIDNDIAQPPLAPNQLTAILNEINQVILNWQDNSLDEIGFVVLRDEQTLTELAADIISYADNSLQCGIVYQYQIYAKNEAGDSLPSNRVSVELPCLTLQAPDNFTATIILDTQIDLTWLDTNTSEIGYQIIRDGHILINTPQNATGFTDANLHCGTQHHYLISAIAVDLTVSPAAEIFASTPNCIGEFSLSLHIQGQGIVNGCTNSCKQSYPQNQTVLLNITPAANWALSHWSGDCSGGQIILDTDKTCTAYFVEQIAIVKPEEIIELLEEVIGQPSITEQLPITETPAALLPPPPVVNVESNSMLDQSANIAGQTVSNIKIQLGSSVSNGTLGGEVINSG
ncbi:tandem-95 repeat protein, partial [Candidatus Albibeggiatoa sp. nov. BB20]|uniref:tandem-95 repeat protein n=1 Tax=Candidatus Albibeggiatoa sp. nov. BB20 TaxID=3162723 RepID=UPI003365301D